MKKDDTAKDLSAEQVLSQCLLTQYNFCCAGLGFGVAYAVKYKRGFVPLLVGGVVGCVTDLLYGWNIGCASEVNQYRNDGK